MRCSGSTATRKCGVFLPEGVLSREDTLEELEWHMNGHPTHPELGLWATIHRQTGHFIGRCGLLPWTLDGVPEVEVAYLIDKAYWNQGLGTEAARGVRDYAHQTLGLTRLVCLIDEDNRASIRVAEKIGMVFERESRDEAGSFHLYALKEDQNA